MQPRTSGDLVELFSRGPLSPDTMQETVRFESEKQRPRAEVAAVLRTAAEQIDSGTVHLQSETADEQVTIPETPRLEVELEREADPDTGEQRYELEYELGWRE